MRVVFLCFLVPHTFPLSFCFYSPSALSICPNICSCLYLMVFSIWPFPLLLGFTSFQSMKFFITLLMYYISVASSLLFYVFRQCSAFTSQLKDGPYVGFRNVDFGVNSKISVVQMAFILVNLSLDKAISSVISVSHLASGLIVKSKYLKGPTCFISSPTQRMSHTEMSDCFEMPIHSVYSAFSLTPLFSLSTVTILRMFLQFFLQSQRLTLCHPPILDCSCCYLRL